MRSISSRMRSAGKLRTMASMQCRGLASHGRVQPSAHARSDDAQFARIEVVPARLLSSQCCNGLPVALADGGATVMLPALDDRLAADDHPVYEVAPGCEHVDVEPHIVHANEKVGVIAVKNHDV